MFGQVQTIKTLDFQTFLNSDLSLLTHIFGILPTYFGAGRARSVLSSRAVSKKNIFFDEWLAARTLRGIKQLPRSAWNRLHGKIAHTLLVFVLVEVVTDIIIVIGDRP